MSARLLCLCSVLLCNACWDNSDGPCLDGLETGDRYVITLGETVVTTPPSACPVGFDLTAGTELTATVAAIESDAKQCAAGRADIAPFDSWTWSSAPSRTGTNGGADLLGTYAADNGECTGTVNFTVLVGGKICERSWTPDSASGACPPSCYDKLECTVTKAP